MKENSSMNKQGTGLGLFICKKICERMQGQIRVESKINKGSSFIFNIPLIDYRETNK